MIGLIKSLPSAFLKLARLLFLLPVEETEAQGVRSLSRSPGRRGAKPGLEAGFVMSLPKFFTAMLIGSCSCF